MTVAIEERAARTSLTTRLLKNPTGLIVFLFLVLVVLGGVFADWLAPGNPSIASLKDVLAPISSEHPLGADTAGRDVLSRLLFATRFSLAGAALATFVAVVIGLTAGLIAGYFGGWFDTVSSWLTGLLMAVPGMIVLLAAASVLGRSMWLSMVILGVLISPAFYRLVYTTVRGVREELFVDAARVAGLTDRRIISRHILVVVRAPIVIQAAMVTGIAIAIQAGLDFLGLGDSSIPTWGSMLNDAFTKIYTNPQLMLWPSMAIGATSIALTVLGNVIRDELERSGEPKKKRRRKMRNRDDVGVLAPQESPVVHAEPAGAATSANELPFGEVLLTVTGLSIGYDQPDGSVKAVVHDVGLSVRRGEIHGLIGESGSGKTQTAWSILRVLPESGRILTGSIKFGGTELASLSENGMTELRGTRIAYVPQEPMSNLDPTFTIGSQLIEPMRYSLKITKAEATARALELLKRVGIVDPKKTFDAYPHEVSGGMAQRVLIAGAISCNPDLLIADEPTTALDVTVQAEVLDLLRDLQSELGMAMILVTHNFGVVADLCDRVSVMREGRIVETGPVRPLFANPQHPYTRSLFAAILDEGEPRGDLMPAPSGESL
ncbi:dipeptide/oligopeptide/nickel ABC transporter permease/ATP-binding protein [Paenarthrobacter nicotinovorans]|uniref:dipeptide/oligopeptide/nickel ABC transporter permease/ATP-binding protein n=1 Tax=Paenarthrobacter nicotinovorans TaxID=29320 RepID=UPI003748BBF6